MQSPELRQSYQAILESLKVIKITETTAPILLVSISPKSADLNLDDIRDLASGGD